jgi:hypothetical protein
MPLHPERSDGEPGSPVSPSYLWLNQANYTGSWRRGQGLDRRRVNPVNMKPSSSMRL